MQKQTNTFEDKLIDAVVGVVNNLSKENWSKYNEILKTVDEAMQK